MKNFIAINGSPRRSGNTSTLLQHAIHGAQSAGAKTELIHLYSLDFKGCTSCFACKLKSRPHGTCAMRDELSPVLERIKQADAIIFGSPIYFMNISSGLTAFIERLFFSNYIYNDEFIFPKKLPSAYFYTMNMTQTQFEKFGVAEQLKVKELFTKRILGVEPKILCAFDTVQFKDYSRYESSIFDPDEKFAYREKQFPVDCENAYDLGRELILQ